MDVKFPIGQLELPEVVTKKEVDQWLDKINSYTDRLGVLVEDLTEEQLTKTYREGAWNVRQLVHHIADSQLVMYQRLKLALTDDNPTVPPFIQDEWANLVDNELPCSVSLAMLSGINERIVALGRRITDEQLQRTFTLQGSGEISVATKLAKLCWHEEHHLAHIKIALEKL